MWVPRKLGFLKIQKKKGPQNATKCCLVIGALMNLILYNKCNKVSTFSDEQKVWILVRSAEHSSNTIEVIRWTPSAPNHSACWVLEDASDEMFLSESQMACAQNWREPGLFPPNHLPASYISFFVSVVLSSQSAALKPSNHFTVIPSSCLSSFSLLWVSLISFSHLHPIIYLCLCVWEMTRNSSRLLCIQSTCK